MAEPSSKPINLVPLYELADILDSTSTTYFLKVCKDLSVAIVQMKRFPVLHPNIVEDSPEHQEFLNILAKYHEASTQFARCMKNYIKDHLDD